MQISIIAVGKLKEDYFKRAMDEYLKRLSPFAKTNILEISEGKSPALPSSAQIYQIKAEEGKGILEAIPAKAYHFALAIEGKALSSPGFAENLAALALAGHSHLTFSIGGSWGLSDEVLRKADYLLSFGKMTFPHQLMRVILVEQIYRGYKINSGSAYHK